MNRNSKPVTMDFSRALLFLKDGQKLSRLGWNGKDMFIFIVGGYEFKSKTSYIVKKGSKIKYQAHIDMKTVQGTIVPWIASQSDLLANDWIIV